MNSTPAQIKFRANLWHLFLKDYMYVLANKPETFSAYCAEFRERWIAGE